MWMCRRRRGRAGRRGRRWSDWDGLRRGGDSRDWSWGLCGFQICASRSICSRSMGLERGDVDMCTD